LFKFKKPNIFIIIDIWHDDFWNFTQFLRQLATTAAVACDVTGRQLFFKTAGLQLRVYFDSGKQKTADHSTSWKMMSNVLLIYGHSWELQRAGGIGEDLLTYLGFFQSGH
jgi:hypothetical protein